MPAVASSASQSRTVLITGGNSGLGLACAEQIHRLRPEYSIVLSGRSAQQGAEAVKAVQKAATSSSTSKGEVRFMRLDLQSQADVRRFVAEFVSAQLPPLGFLLLNAGIQSRHPVPHTEDGIAGVYATNHLSQFLLYQLLRPHFAAGQVRLTVTSSGVHDPAQKTGLPDAVYTSGERIAHPVTAEEELGLVTYSISKLCNVYFTYGLHDRLQRSSDASRFTVNAFDPGLVFGTGLQRSTPLLYFLARRVLPPLTPFLRWVTRQPNIHTLQESGFALARLAIDPDGELSGVSGRYFEGLRQIRSSELSYNEKNRQDLWDSSVNLTAKTEAERQTFNSF